MALVPFPSVTPGDDEDDDPATDDSGSKMSFLEHLDELRKRLIYIVYSLIAGCVIAYIFIGKLFDFIMKPMYQMLPHDAVGGAGKLMYTAGSEPFMLYIKIGFLAGIFISSKRLLVTMLSTAFRHIWCSSSVAASSSSICCAVKR